MEGILVISRERKEAFDCHSKKFRSYYLAKVTNYPNHYYDFTMCRAASENPKESSAPLTNANGYGILLTFADLLCVI